MKSASFRLPSPTERVAVFGRTGSGKTVFMTWLLSHASIEDRPWIVIDHKDDDYLGDIPRIEKIKLGEIPKHPGIYHVSASFNDDDKLDEYLHRILARGNIGIFSDEGNSIPQREPRYKGLKSIFAKGRSKRVPFLYATQKPAWTNRSVLSESDFFAAFHLQHADDRETAGKFIPGGVEPRLDDYHARWYDVKQDAHFVIKPVNNDETMERFEERLKPRQRLL